MLYILNEKDYIRNILASKEKPADLSMGYFITLVAKNYYPEEVDAEELSNRVKGTLSEFHLDNYQEYKYHNKIVRVCESLFDGSMDKSLKERESIPIYMNELDFIRTLPADRHKKLMFTFFAVARYMDCDGWINKKTSKDISEVCKLANVTLMSDQRNKLLHELYTNGYISFGKKVDNLNLKVNLDDSGEIGYKIEDFAISGTSISEISNRDTDNARILFVARRSGSPEQTVNIVSNAPFQSGLKRSETGGTDNRNSSH